MGTAGLSGRRLAAIMFTDMVGYTVLGQKNESLSLMLVEEQRKLIRPLLARHGGREVKTMGDAFLIEFANALDAVRCAYDIQRASREFNVSQPDDRRIHLRIGLHLGDVEESEGDILGDAVNVASRIQPLAVDGGVCLTRQVYDQIRNKFELPLTSLGVRSLRNVSVPVEVYQMEMPWKGEGPVSVQEVETKRVAVLPFANLSPDPSDSYFADGTTEEIISSASKIRGLGVIARTSVMRYKGTAKSVAEIGRELRVATLLEGSVRKAGKKLRISVQLVDAKTEEPVWSQTYDRELEDVFAVQSDIAQRIARTLKVRVLHSERLGLEKKPTENTGAYSEYMKGRLSLNSRTEEGARRAIELFEKALRQDPKYALAYTGMADAYAVLALLELVPPKEAFPKARAAAEKALELDGSLAEAHASLGLAMFQYEWDWPRAEDEFKRAVELRPNYAPAHQFYADYLKAMGRFDEALAEMGRAHALDPLSLAILTGVGHVLYLSRQYDKAIEEYKSVVKLDPTFLQARLWFGRPYLQKGMFKEAISELEEATKLSSNSTISLAMLGQAYGAAGRKKEMEEIREKLLERAGRQYVPSYWISLLFVGLGDRDQAFYWLERAFQERSSWLVWAKVEPRFDVLRSDARFTSLLSRMRLSSEKEE